MSADSDDRYCTNCRAEIPRGEDSCPACGVFAGDVFDGTWPRKKTRTRLWLALLVLAIAAAGGALWYEQQSRGGSSGPAFDLPGVRVVADRPGGSRKARGATVTEAEAVRILRREIVATKSIRNDCIALIGDRKGAAYTFNVFDRCAKVRLGRWRVDAKSGRPAMARPDGPG